MVQDHQRFPGIHKSSLVDPWKTLVIADGWLPSRKVPPSRKSGVYVAIPQQCDTYQCCSVSTHPGGVCQLRTSSCNLSPLAQSQHSEEVP